MQLMSKRSSKSGDSPTPKNKKVGEKFLSTSSGADSDEHGCHEFLSSSRPLSQEPGCSFNFLDSSEDAHSPSLSPPPNFGFLGADPSKDVPTRSTLNTTSDKPESEVETPVPVVTGLSDSAEVAAVKTTIDDENMFTFLKATEEGQLPDLSLSPETNFEFLSEEDLQAPAEPSHEVFTQGSTVTTASGNSDLAQFIKEEEQVYEFETTVEIDFKELVTNNISSKGVTETAVTILENEDLL